MPDDTNPERTQQERVLQLVDALGERLRALDVSRIAVDAFDMSIEIERAVTTVAPAVEHAPAAEERVEERYVRSPLVGVLYLRPGPDEDEFVSVGSVIEPGATVALIETMKVYNACTSPIGGKVVEILVQDGQAVEFDQPLLKLE